MNSLLNHRGQVTLVGAGPGDPELLTLKAVKAIAAATVLLVDDLVNEAVLAHASPTARIVHVGKRGGCKSTPQAFIEKLMVIAVHEGDNVVRLIPALNISDDEIGIGLDRLTKALRQVKATTH